MYPLRKRIHAKSIQGSPIPPLANMYGWHVDFLHLDVFARAVKQIRGIPKGRRASSPTDRLTLRVTNQHTTKQVPLPHFFKNLFPSPLKKEKNYPSFRSYYRFRIEIKESESLYAWNNPTAVPPPLPLLPLNGSASFDGGTC
uniref:Uncharacterized protein n=1 Tax=Vespula pensylvanica TaxID=30213 RepID=A0A834KPK8_VESPE|nr:hypothetical protein H0235_013238 [Vespula pensylvanica]